LSDQDDEPELRALQGDPDDAFAPTRPRPGYQDSLFLRTLARPPSASRLSHALGPPFAGTRAVSSRPLTK